MENLQLMIIRLSSKRMTATYQILNFFFFWLCLKRDLGNKTMSWLSQLISQVSEYHLCVSQHSWMGTPFSDQVCVELHVLV